MRLKETAVVPDALFRQDFRDVLAWLEHRYSARNDLWMHVMQAPSQLSSELSIATIDTDRKDIDVGQLHGDFLSALAALGYRMAWPKDGADPEDVDVPPPEQMPDHERLASIIRIEQALHQVLPLRRDWG